MIKRFCISKSFGISLMGICFPLFFHAQSYEQIYEEASQEVKSLMDNNKMLGESILSGVCLQLIISIESKDGDHKEFPSSFFSSNPDVWSFVFDPSTSCLKVECAPMTPLDLMKSKLTQEGWILKGILSKSYIVRENKR